MDERGPIPTRRDTVKGPHLRRAPLSGRIAWAVYDAGVSALGTVIQAFIFAAYFTRQVAGNRVTGSSEWGTALSIAGLFIAVIGPVLGATIDQAGRRKPWLAGTTGLAVLATALLWFVKPSPQYVWLALLLIGIIGIASQLAFMIYSAMLPTLVEPQRFGWLSGSGWSVGYAGGLTCLVLVLLAFVSDRPWFALDQHSAANVRAAFVFTTAWYLVLAVPLFIFTPDAPSTGKPLRTAARDGLRQLAESVRQVRRHRHVVRFLIADMIYTDGLMTMLVFGGIFASGAFGMQEREVLELGIGLNVAAGAGALGFAWVHHRLGGRLVIIVSLIGLIAVSILTLLAPSVRWLWVFALLLGVFVGPVQAASRSLLAGLAPAELRNEIFGVYALSGKATAFVGPLAVGWLTWWTGSQRLGMSVIVVLFALGLYLVRRLPQPATKA